MIIDYWAAANKVWQLPRFSGFFEQVTYICDLNMYNAKR